MAVSPGMIRLVANAILSLDRRENCLFLGDQQVQATEADLRRALGSRVRVVPKVELDPRLRLSAMHRFRERGMISCLMFAKMFGFSTVDVLDLDIMGHVNVVHDLNHPDMVAKTGRNYDAVFDGGTLEHIFSPDAALRNIGESIRVGGLAIHWCPMNNFINHGFYQISPTLFFDYYGWNKWEIVSARYVCEIDGAMHVYKARAGEFTGADLEYPTEPHSTFFVAKKTAASTVGVIPTQGMYQVRLDAERTYIRLD